MFKSGKPEPLISQEMIDEWVRVFDQEMELWKDYRPWRWWRDPIALGLLLFAVALFVAAALL